MITATKCTKLGLWNDTFVGDIIIIIQLQNYISYCFSVFTNMVGC